MSDALAAEWLKLRSVRSTYGLLAALVLLLAGAWAVDTAMIHAWDSAAPAEQANYESADMSVVIVPLAQFLLAILGALVITAEYRTGSILTTLAAVPDRRRLLAAKATLVALVAASAGSLLVLASAALSVQVAGDRPPPIKPFQSFTHALGAGLATETSLLVAALVGLGLGAVIRSSAGSVAALTGLLFVAPVLAAYLPAPWDTRVSGVLLGSLGAQLDGAPGSLLTPAAAALALLTYLLLCLTPALHTLTHRDA